MKPAVQGAPTVDGFSPSIQPLNVQAFRASSLSQFASTPVAVANVNNVGGWGAMPIFPALSLHKAASAVHGRFHLCDLTAAGLTVQQFVELEYAEFQRAYAVGGRYYGDTVPTAPASIP